MLLSKNKLILLYFFSFLLNDAFGQSGSIDPKILLKSITPTSPDVTTLGRYIMQAPDHSNGLPQQNIPLHEIKENDISYPISLFYNYSGFRLTEDASSVGLGWGLSENVIIRIVKHRPDEAGGLKQFKDFGNLVTEENGQGFTEGYYMDPEKRDASYNLTHNRLFYKLYDGQPDLYIYNCNGYSGKFLIIDNQVINLENNDVIITRDGAPFVITTPEGIRYSFQEGEKANPTSATYGPSCGGGPIFTAGDGIPTTTWRLTEIKSNITNSKITITYKANGLNTNRVNNKSSIVSFTAPKEVDGGYRISDVVKDEYFDNYGGQLVIPEEIVTDNSKILFVTKSRSDGIALALDAIKIYSKQDLINPIKTITFNHEYFGDVSSPNTCWLKLKEVRINGGGSNLKHRLAYVNETGSTTSYTLSKEGMGIDHWGYFNGASNSTLVPFGYGVSAFIQTYKPNFSSGFTYANREPDFFHAKTFALETIVYPTGGYTKFNYESAGGKGLRVASLEDFDGKQTNHKFYKYFPDQSVPVFYDKTEYYMDGCCSIGPQQNPSILKATFFSSAKNTLDYYDDNINQYSKVIEYIGTSDGQGGRTEYNYTWYGAYYTHKRFLSEKTDYAFGNANFIKKEKYTYNPAILKTIEYWEVPKLLQTGMPVSQCDYLFGQYQPGCCPMDPESGYQYILGQFDGGVRSTTAIWYRLTTTETIDGAVQHVKTFEYKPVDQTMNLPQHSNPIKTEETLSSGQVKQTYYYYPGDADPDNSSNTLGIPQMWDASNSSYKHYITPVMKSKTFVNNTLTSKELHNFSYDAANGYILRTGYEALPRGVEAGKISWNYGYNNKAKLVSILKAAEVEKVYIWGYNHMYPVAEIVGAGSYSNIISGLNSNIIDNVNGTYTDQQIRSEINKIRTNYPNAQVTTYTYNALKGITSQTDGGGRTTYYDYDVYGRLKMIKDQDGKILKVYEYKHYQ